MEKKIYHLALPNICNQQCVFCVISAIKWKEKRELDIPSLYQTIMANTQEGEWVSIWGGEPTAWENISLLFRVIKKAQRNAYLITNGSRPDQIEKLVDAGIEEAVFSFFTCNESLHNKLTSSKHFSCLMQSLQLFKNAKRTICINWVVCKENENTLFEDVKKLLALFPIFHITFQLMIPLGRWASMELADLDTVATQINLATEFLKQKGVILHISFFPHCLLSHPEFGEKYEQPRDNKRDRFSQKAHSTKNTECAKCSVSQTCGGVPLGYQSKNIKAIVW